MKQLALFFALCSSALAVTCTAPCTATATFKGLNTTTSGAITTSGNFLAMSVSYSTAVAPTISDSKSNTWTALTVTSDGGGASNVIYYAKNATVGASHTFTFTCTACSGMVVVASFSGIDTASPFDLQNGAFSNSFTTLQTGSISPTAGYLVLVGFEFAETFNVTAITIDSGFTIIDQQWFSGGSNWGGALAYKTAAGGAVNPTWTMPTSGISGSTRIASFKVAATGFVPRRRGGGFIP